ncbi:unnamed protein product [Parnassius apollo]|uniref:(apollo) hypothetical protein n=1 Tax=Parnassius apollo TaxID=110799 RepID=A0A8S3X4J7_PARAO|nr:unnamed protein product [Parnassius apollo]
MLFRRRSLAVKYFIALFFGAVAYNEWIIYVVQPIYWQHMKCPHDDKYCTKIMFIADPQIQGEMAVPPPLSYLFNWDSDRYLGTTFKIALKYFKPDILVYLGDLMDEGSIATMTQFHSYVRRLSNIFEVPYPIIQVWLPGDNDIGGENEPIRRDKLEEFNKVFNQPSIITYRNISFYKVNGITHSFPHAKGDDNYKIVVSHYPLLRKSVFGKQVNDAIHPNIYFCAHEHKSKYFIKDENLRNIFTRYIRPGDEILNINHNEENIYEIYVPTCSYRMGTQTIGYGAAVLVHNDHHLHYTVLWSPRRFPSLFTYAVVLIIAILYMFIFCLSRVILRCMVVKNSDSTQPLLIQTS